MSAAFAQQDPKFDLEDKPVTISIKGKSFWCTSCLSLIIVGLTLLLPTLAVGQTFVQAATDDPAPTKAASIAVPFSSAQGAGHLNLVIVGWSNSSSTVTSVADSAGNTYKLAVGTQSTQSVANAVSQAIYYAENIKAASNTITVTFNQSTDFPDVRILEYSGVSATSPLDVVAVAMNSTSPATSGTVTTTTASDIVVGGGTTSGGFTNSTPPANFTIRLFNNSTGDIAGDSGPVAPGPVSLSDAATGNWVMQLAAFGSTPRAPLASPTLDPTSPVTPTSVSDAGGDSVTITGTNFAPGATVLFGTISGVNCTVASSTSITCLSPAHADGAVDITVTNVDGQSAVTSGQPFSFVLVATPSISTVTPAGGVTNGGTAITISGSNFVAPAKVDVGGEPASNVTVSNGGSQITADTPAGAAGPATVKVTNSNGTSGTKTNAYTYQASPGISFVQVASTTSSAATSVPVAYTLPQAAGDLNIVVVGWNDTTTPIQSVTDSAGNAYTLALNVTKGTNLSQAIYYAKNIRANTNNTVTVTFTASAAFPDVRVLEYSGIDVSSPLDGAAAASGTGLVADSGALSTTHAFDLILGAATVSSNVSAPGAGFTTVEVTPFDDNAQHQIVNATGSYHASASLSPSGNWVMQAVAFKASATTAPSFTLSASPANQSVAAGSSASYTVSVTGQAGFSGTVNLAVTCPANAGLACSVSPATVTPGSAPGTATVTVGTTGRSASLTMPQDNKTMLPLYAVWLPLPGIALAGAGLAGSRRRKLGIGATVVLLFLLFLLLVGCGGGGSNSGGGGGGGTPTGTYNVTVTASSGSLSQNTTVTLTVQ